MSGRPTRVLVVDDSAFARKVLREILSAEPDLEVVGTARDGIDALEKIAELRPDVVTLDLVMPELDGVGVLGALDLADRPRVIVVTMSDQDSELGVAALAAGAIDVVHKPIPIAADRLYELGAELVTKVRGASRAQPRVWPQSSVPAPPPEKRLVDIIVMGASTGGPQAVAHVLRALPAAFPVPIAVVIHLPVGYTQPYADRIDRDCALSVLEARHDLELGPGMAGIARAGVHLRLRRGPRGPVSSFDGDQHETLHRPSVDVLFGSAAEVWGERVLGVVLTGMGDDGLKGARAVRSRGGRVLVEASSTCVVYGMPRAVAEAGLADAQVPLGQIAAAITSAVMGGDMAMPTSH